MIIIAWPENYIELDLKAFYRDVWDITFGLSFYIGNTSRKQQSVRNLNYGVVLGDNVNLHKGCTIGRTNRGNSGSPCIGNNVFVGINSVIVGNIHIGSDVLIAPNSYVNIDVPDHSIVIGNPATIHANENATEGYINFRV